MVDDSFLIRLIIDYVIRSDKHAYKFVISFEISQIWHFQFYFKKTSLLDDLFWIIQGFSVL